MSGAYFVIDSRVSGFYRIANSFAVEIRHECSTQKLYRGGGRERERERERENDRT